MEGGKCDLQPRSERRKYLAILKAEQPSAICETVEFSKSQSGALKRFFKIINDCGFFGILSCRLMEHERCLMASQFCLIGAYVISHANSDDCTYGLCPASEVGTRCGDEVGQENSDKANSKYKSQDKQYARCTKQLAVAPRAFEPLPQFLHECLRIGVESYNRRYIYA
ncbi:hypothetical protein APT56_10115 [Achromobacter denitrificans]|nr:hypothetical protein APT56_10115 [Achromobacter denitrificans]